MRPTFHRFRRRAMNNRILCVDDEEKVLKGITRQLSDDFAVDTANSGHEGLRRIAQSEPYAVVVSDMRMPAMNGIQFLQQVRQQSPDTTRILLTGFADLNTTVAAINDGHIFRFLAKPCPAAALSNALSDGIKQYQLVTSEKELVDGTLKGSVKVLSDVLGLVNPVAFGRASRVKRIVLAIARYLGAKDIWELEIAAMMSALGCVTIPDNTLEKLIHGRPLTAEEENAFERHPAVASSLLENIPRLGRVAEIVAYQEKHFDGGGFPHDSVRGEAIPFGARILKVALDFDIEEANSESPVEAINRLKQRGHQYDPHILKALGQVLEQLYCLKPRDAQLSDLRNGMVIAENVLSKNGQILIAKGHEVTPSVRRFLSNFVERNNVQLPLKVFIQGSKEPENGQSEKGIES